MNHPQGGFNGISNIHAPASSQPLQFLQTSSGLVPMIAVACSASSSDFGDTGSGKHSPRHP